MMDARDASLTARVLLTRHSAEGAGSVRLTRAGSAEGFDVMHWITPVADERELSERLALASVDSHVGEPERTGSSNAPQTGARRATPADRFVPLLRVVSEDAEDRSQTLLGTVVTGWIRIAAVHASDAQSDTVTIEIEALVLSEVLRYEASGRNTVISPEGAMPADWWGEGEGTSYHWPNRILTADDAVAGIAKIHAELARNGAERVGSLRRRLEALIAAEIRQDPDRGELGAAAVELDRSLAALIDVARVGSAVRSRLRICERSGAFLWRGGAAEDAMYHRVRVAHRQDRDDDLDRGAERSYWLLQRQCADAQAILSDEITASYELLSGVGALAAARDAAGQAQLNRIAGATAVLATVVGTVLALYGANLAVPFMDQRPWLHLAGTSVVVGCIFLMMRRGSRDVDDQRWWRRAASLSFAVGALFSALSAAQWNAPEHDAQLTCERTSTVLTCTGESVPPPVTPPAGTTP